MPELQHSQRKWPIPITLFAVAITLVFIGMKWREARRKRKLKEWRIARWERRRWGVPVDDERPLAISIPYWRQKRWEEELERRAETKRQAEREVQEAEEAEERRMKPRFISKAPWAQTKEDKEYLAWKAEKERQKKEKEALEMAQTNAQLNAQRSLEMIRQATPIRNSTQERVPIVQIVSPRPTTAAVTEPTNGNAEGEEESPIVVPIASRTRPPPAKSALRKNTSRKRPVIDVDVDAEDEAADRQAKKQKPNTREADVDAVTPMVTDTTEMADEEAYDDPQMPGAFEVAAPKPKPALQPAQVQASRKRPASDDLEQDQTGQRKRTKHGKVDLTTPAAHEDVTAVEPSVTPAESKALTRPRGTKRARSDVGSEFGDKIRVKKKGKKMAEIVDVEMDDQDKPQQQQQQLVVSNGARKSKRASVVNGKRKPVLEDEDEDAMDSTDPLCKGRKIGSEWEIGNRRFRVGPDGKRLRLAPLRTWRKKYEMPIDSVHPDATAMIEVLVDTWLTEGEYKLAREQGNLGWQIITPTTPERKPNSRRSSMSYSVQEDEQLPGKENKLPFPSSSPNEPGSGSDSPGKALMWNSGRIRGVSNSSLPTSPSPIMGSIPTTPGRSNRLSLLEPLSTTTTKLSTTGSQTAVSLSSGVGNPSTPARSGGTVITVRQITTTPGGGMPSWSGMQKGRASWARPAGANGMQGRHMFSMIEKREAEARVLEKLRARVTDSKAADASSQSGGLTSAAAPTSLPVITVTIPEPPKPPIVTSTKPSLFAPPAAQKVDAPNPPRGVGGNLLPSPAATTTIATAPSSSALAPPPSFGLGLAAPSISAPTTAPMLAPAINLAGDRPPATTSTEAPSLFSRFGTAPPAGPAPTARKEETVAKPPFFGGLTGFGAPPSSVPRPTLPTPNFGAPTTTTTTAAAAPPTIPTPTFNPTPAPTSQPQPPKPAFSFPMTGFNSQQPAAVPPAMESKEKEPPKAPSFFGSFPAPTPPSATTTAPATSAISMPGPFVNFGKFGATAPTLTTPAMPSSGSLFGNNKLPQAPGTTAAQTTGSLFGAPLASTEVVKPAGGAFSGAFSKPNVPAPAPAAQSTGFSSFANFGAPKPAPESEEKTKPSQTLQPPASESLFSRLGAQSSQRTPSSFFGAPPTAPAPSTVTGTTTTQPAEPPKPVFPGITLPLPKPTPSFSAEGPFGTHVMAFNTHNSSSVPAPASGNTLYSKRTPPVGGGKEVPASANATSEGSAPPALFGGGFSIKGAAAAAAPTYSYAPTPAEPSKRRNGGFFGSSITTATSTSTSSETPTAATLPKRNGGFFGGPANASGTATTPVATEQPKANGLFTGSGALGSGSTFGSGLNSATGLSGATKPFTGGFSGFAGGATGAPKFGAPTFGSAALAEKKDGDKPTMFGGFGGFPNAAPSSSGATTAPAFGAPTTFKFQTSNSNPTAAATEGSAAPPPLFGFGSAKPGGLFAASTTPATAGGGTFP